MAETRSAYAYVAGNPLNSIDPTGLATHWLSNFEGWNVDRFIQEALSVGNREDACAWLARAMRTGLTELKERRKEFLQDRRGFIKNGRQDIRDAYNLRYIRGQHAMGAMLRAYLLLGCDDLSAGEYGEMRYEVSRGITNNEAYETPEDNSDLELWLLAFAAAASEMGKDSEFVAAGG